MLEEATLVFKGAKLAKEYYVLAKSLWREMPNGKQKEDAEQKIESLASELAAADAETAKSLGYDLCQCTFPPQIMLYKQGKGVTKCPACGNTRQKRTTVEFF